MFASTYIRPLGLLARFGDWVMRPIMYVLAGTAWEAPQETHRWNNRHLSKTDIVQLSNQIMVTSNGDPTAVARLLLGFIPLFHCPICGGWRHYVVLQPIDYTPEWYVGWLSEDANGVSLLPNKGPVRVVEGAKPASWFGVTKNGRQIPLRLLGKGRIGDGGPFANIPLR